MKAFRLVSMLALILALGVATTSCKKVKDADVQTAVQTALAANPDLADVSVAVLDQVATLTGTVQDDETKALAETTVAAVKNVKSVVNNLEVVPPAPDFTEIDAALNAALVDALKDHATVVAEVKEGVVTLTGEIKKRDLQTLMEKVNALNPQQVVNNITVK
ncbi:MAG: BON domain-containing protein [Petrimonas sp.]|jgi:osmotically-inducible protein OsmY|nr:MAG: BON domain protein [Bacteroidetes bacterium ADurb.BinA174]